MNQPTIWQQVLAPEYVSTAKASVSGAGEMQMNVIIAKIMLTYWICMMSVLLDSEQTLALLRLEPSPPALDAEILPMICVTIPPMSLIINASQHVPHTYISQLLEEAVACGKLTMLVTTLSMPIDLKLILMTIHKPPTQGNIEDKHECASCVTIDACNAMGL